MLAELTISHFAIIERLSLSLGPGFNVFTGETGAGKSIIIDAISALVGERVGADVVRTGAERAIIEGAFDVAALLAQADTPGQRSATSGDEGVDEDAEGAGALAALLEELG